MRHYPRVVWCGLLLLYAVSGFALVSAVALKQALQIQQNFPESEDARKRLAALEKKP
jgi:hypothetical protein